MVSRESALVLNNILLAVSAFVVFVGTVWPLVAELVWGRKLSVGPPFFNLAFTPFMIALALILPIGAMMPWKRAMLQKPVRAMVPVAVLAIAVGLLIWAMQTGRSAQGPIGVGLGLWLVCGAALDVLARTGRGGLGQRLGRLGRLPRADWGKAVAHAGFGVTILGVSAMLAWQSEDIRVAQLGETFTVAGYDVTLVDVKKEQGPNYISTRAEMDVARNGVPVAVMFPEKREYPVAGMATTEAAIDNGVLRDLYLVIGDPQDNGGWAVRAYVKPFASWIWAGAIIMALGGGLSLSDRRYRVAAGSRRAEPTPVAAE